MIPIVFSGSLDVAEVKSLKPYELVLPTAIPALTGEEINIYFDNLMIGDARRYEFDVISKFGVHQNDRWTAVPDSPGDHCLEIRVYNEEGDLLSSAETTIRVADSLAGAGTSRQALFIGDSTTEAGHYTGELLRLFSNDPMDLKLIGTRGTVPNVHEGRGGWKVITHFEDPRSSFRYNNVFDFSKYMDSNGFTGLTDVCIHLGINEIYHAAGEKGMEQLIAQEMPMMDAMIASIRAYHSTIRIGIMLTIPPARDQDSFGNSYGTLQNRRIYKPKLQIWNRELQSRYGHRENENIHLIPVNVNLDTVHNMPWRWELANSRSSKQVVRQCNDVHPAPEGYDQMADVLYYWFKVLS